MNKKSVSSKTINTIPLSVLKGIIIMVFIILVGAIIGASVIDRGIIDGDKRAFIVTITWFAASLCGTFVSGKSEKDKFLLTIALTVAVFLLLLFSLKMMFFNGELYAPGKGLIFVLLGTLPSILMLNKQKNKKRTKFKYSAK